MNDRRRSGERWSQLELELLRSAKGDGPAAGARKRALVVFGGGGIRALAGGVGARAAAGVASKAAGPLAGGVSKFVLVGAGKWIGLALLGVGAIGAAGFVSQRGLRAADDAASSLGAGRPVQVVSTPRTIAVPIRRELVASVPALPQKDGPASESYPSSTPPASTPGRAQGRAAITRGRSATLAPNAVDMMATAAAVTTASSEVATGATNSFADQSATARRGTLQSPDLGAPPPLPLLTPPPSPTLITVGPDLAAEMASLDAARVAQAAKRPELALRALDDYARRFPRGVLAQEAMVLRIDAVTARGDRSAASALGKAFLETFPKSPHAPRLRAALGL